MLVSYDGLDVNSIPRPVGVKRVTQGLGGTDGEQHNPQSQNRVFTLFTAKGAEVN